MRDEMAKMRDEQKIKELLNSDRADYTAPPRAPRSEDQAAGIAGQPMQTRYVGPKEALMNRLESEESHAISRLTKLREIKLEVTMAGDRDCDLFERLASVLNY